ncbi:MAG: N-acetyl-gamma-glutamyl-phosphate reductase [Clostridiales bacterium]|nr:N-acetyl-gamma-glutamyl-phosphate reductase [Clostridiales bacterium]
MIKVGIIGATGYAGVELVRIITNHPQAELTAVCSVSFVGQPISEVYPSLNGICDLKCVTAEEVIEQSDVVFAGVQAGISQEFAKQCYEKGVKFIDLGADFRLEDEEDYKQWYGGEYIDKKLHEEAIYALPELFREQIKGKSIIGNPGCYPTSVALGLAPALRAGLVKTDDNIIIDSKSGVTGAGRKLTDTSHYPACNEAFSPYKIACHRHTPEIEQTLSKVANTKITVTFVPHLLPLNRGIISTMYVKAKDGVSLEQIRSEYEKAYKDEQFVRVLADGKTANLRDVKCSNYCDISLHFDSRTSTLIVVSTIDNMVKGAAGQAIQNMNIIFGLPENTGLNMVPTAF